MKITQTYTIKAPLKKVWQALTDAAVMNKWGAGPVEFDATVDGDFSLWDGSIYGVNTDVVVNKLLKQEWTSQDSATSPHHVTFELSFKDDVTTVTLIHDDVPKDEVQSFTNGWDDYYFDPIIDLLT